MAQTIINALIEQFTRHASSSTAESQQAYMLHQFSYFGIPTPLRRSLQKQIFKEYKINSYDQLISIIGAMWHHEKRELHYAAMELAYHYRALWQPDILSHFKKMIETNSWWDTVDYIASKLVGTLLLQHSNLIDYMDRWITDSNKWVRRSALIFQLSYKQKTDTHRLFSYCEQQLHDTDFFIRKAIGWALRQYSKTDPTIVKKFVEKHHATMSRVTYNEAVKYI